MSQSNTRSHFWALKIFEKQANLIGMQHPFINNCLTGQAADRQLIGMICFPVYAVADKADLQRDGQLLHRQAFQ